MNIHELRVKELQLLAAERKKNPELFKTQTYLDDASFLAKIGITLPKMLQENINAGYLKFLPQDFIVEEVLQDGSVQTIDLENKDIFGQGPTIYATLVKCGLSTIEVVEEIHLRYGIDKKSIQYAGIKDQDAITSQLISFTGQDLEKVQSISSPHFFLKNIHLGNNTVQVGKLTGNRFTILVRTDETFDEKKFLVNLETVQKNGFYNFYYSQRFSYPRFINWFWGMHILKRDYKKAVLSVLCSEGLRENGYFLKIRSEIQRHFGDWEKVRDILQPMAISFHHEMKMIGHLQKNPTDFAGALNQVREQVQLWIFAYPSLLFNREISQYISAGQPVPEKLPLLLSRDPKDWEVYQDFLHEDDIKISPNLLKPFPFITWKKRLVNTKEMVKIHNMKITKQGVALSFTLPKGCYATSFLSHMFELITGVPPTTISTEAIDTKATLGNANMQNILEKFKEVIIPKTENTLDRFE